MLKRGRINKGSGEEFIDFFNEEEYDEGIRLLDTDFEWDYEDSESGITPLIMVLNNSPEGEFTDVAMRILNSGYCNPYVIMKDGSSALSMACRFGLFEVVNRLLWYKKINCRHRDEDNNTPLMNCLLYKSVDCAKLLLYSHYDIYIEYITPKGRSALQLSLKKDLKEIALIIYSKLPLKHHIKYLSMYEKLIYEYKKTDWMDDFKFSFQSNLMNSYFFIQLNEKIFKKIVDYIHFR